MDKPRIKPLRWEYHPAGAKAEPPTGHAYIIDTRMEGRVYTIKGLNPQREFASTDDAKAAAQVDYEARILAALEPVTVRICQKCGHPENNHPYRHMFVALAQEDT